MSNYRNVNTGQIVTPVDDEHAARLDALARWEITDQTPPAKKTTRKTTKKAQAPADKQDEAPDNKQDEAPADSGE